MNDDLFDQIHARLQGQYRNRDYHCNCPWCGKEAKKYATHFSYSEKGFKCFVCGEGGTLGRLAKHLNVDGDWREPQPRPEPQPRTRPAWLDNATRLLAGYTTHPRRRELWDSYKRLPAETLDAYRLGVGVLPASRCRHERLIVPVMDGLRVAWLRGRVIDCDCGKWLASGGVKLADVPLFNADRLQPMQPSQVVWIVENPVDAILVGLRTDYVGVATLSVSYWQDHWTEALRAARPELIVVAYDADLPGNGGPDYWRQKHQWERERGHRAPVPGGVRLVNRLLRAGLPARLFRWPAGVGTDVGEVLGE